MTAKVIFRKDAIRKDGKAPLIIRIIKDRKRAYVTTTIKIESKDWDEERMKVKRSHPEHKRYNLILAKKIAKIEELSTLFEIKGKRYTAKSLAESLVSSNNGCFIQFASDWIEERYGKENLRYSTLLRYRAILNKLKAFHPGELPFDEVDYEFILGFEKYLKKECRNGTNTIGSNLNFIRATVFEAVRRDHMDVGANPFIKYKFKFKDTERGYLKLEEIEQLTNLHLPDKTKLKMSRDIFIFCCDTALRIGDALQLTKDNFTGTHIEYFAHKTGDVSKLLLTGEAKSLIEYYLSAYPDWDYIFPFLDIKGRRTDESALKALKNCTALINKNLKIIGKRAGLSRNLHTHLARHSFATNALIKGLSMEAISGILNHKELRTTQIYGKFVDQMKDDAIRQFESID